MSHRARILVHASSLAFAVLAALIARPALGQTSHNMTLLGHLDSYAGYSSCWGYTAPDGTELAILGTDTGVSFVDCTIPTAPVEVAFIPGPSSIWREMKTYGHYAYIVTEGLGGGLKIVDLVNPHAPVLVTTYLGAFSTCHTIWIDTENALAYCNGTNNGLRILSLANPVAPTLVATWSDFYVHDCYVRDGKCYAGAIYDGFMGILDVSNLPAVTEISRITTPNAACHNTWLTDDGRYCLTTDETGSGHVGIFDVQNPSAPVLRAQFIHPTAPTSSVHNVTVLNDLVPTAWYVNGVEMLDVTSPLTPERVGWYDTFAGTGLYNGVWGVYPYTANNTIYASDMENGLFVLRFTPDYGTLQGTVTSATTSAPLASAAVRVPAAGKSTLTDTSGGYRLHLTPGTYSVIYELYGYGSDTLSVTLPDTSRVTRDAALAPIPSGGLTGVVRAFPGGAPIAGATVTVPGSPLSTTSAVNGAYLFPLVPAGMQTVQASKFGYAPASGSVYIAQGQLVTAGLSLRVDAFVDDVEAARGWTPGVAGDDATAGQWTRVNPNGTGAGLVQPEDDHTPAPGTMCYVTGQGISGGGISSADVDNGRTTLLSPAFNLSGMVRPVLRMHRWYSNDAGPAPGEDTLKVDVSNNGGTSWVAMERLTQTRNFWEQKDYVLSDYVTPTANVRVRIVASDYLGASVVEAAVDDIEIFESGTTTGVPDVAGAGLPSRPRLALAASPNPFAVAGAATALRFELAGSSPVLLDIYDVEGRRVRRVANARLEGGTHEFRWDGANDEGRAVAAGIYLARLQTPGEAASAKLIVIP